MFLFAEYPTHEESWSLSQIFFLGLKSQELIGVVRYTGLAVNTVMIMVSISLKCGYMLLLLREKMRWMSAQGKYWIQTP